MNKAIWQNGIHALIIAVVIGLCLAISPSQKDAPHGILLPAGKPYASLAPEQVKLYSSFPEQYIVVGQIRTMLHITAGLTQDDIDRDAKSSYLYARELAAKAGANGVVIKTIGTTNESGPLDAMVIYATAIHI